MLDHITAFYDGLPGLIRWLLSLMFNIILIRGLLANEILQELRQRGIFKEGILHAMEKQLSKWGKLARKAAILEHYRLHGQGAGHESGDVLHCGQGRCGMF